MQKHDKMVALAKEKSAEMTETAITAIETMYRKNIKISVAELTKLTGLSRGFFYNNPNVKQPRYQYPLSFVMVGVNTYSPPCFLPKFHHFEEFKCSFKERALYCVNTATF